MQKQMKNKKQEQEQERDASRTEQYPMKTKYTNDTAAI